MAYFGLVFFAMLLGYTIYVGISMSQHRLPLFAFYMAMALLTLGLVPSVAYLLQLNLPAAKVLQPMPITPWHYFTLIVPILAMIVLGALDWKRDTTRDETSLVQRVSRTLQEQPLVPFILLGLGLLAQLLTPQLPAVLRQAGVFGGMILWIGVIHLLFTSYSWPIKMGILLLLFIFMAYRALQSTMFGDLFLWPVWLTFYAQLYYRWSSRALWRAGGIGLLFLFLILVWKYDYRERVKQSAAEDHWRLFSKTTQDWAKNPWDNNRWQQALDRLNQGNHLAQVYQWVPAHEPYARGATIWLALQAALVPRIFWPDKPGAGGAHIWYRFTGNPLSPNCSMNIGAAGEAYANFGPWLAPFIVFAWVRLLYSAYHWLRKLATQHYPLLWLWTPLIFYPLMDQENDFITMLNHGFKATLFTLAICWTLHKLSGYLSKRKYSKP